MIFSAMDAFNDRVNPERVACYLTGMKAEFVTYADEFREVYFVLGNATLRNYEERLSLQVEKIDWIMKQIVAIYFRCNKFEETGECYENSLKVSLLALKQRSSKYS